MVMCKSPISFYFLVLGLNVLLTDAVWELDRSNFEKYRETASFPIFFVDSPSCSRCRLLFPFFYAASQTFVEDRDIYFGRVQDKSLIRQWGIEELPVILYFEKGETEWERLEGDITVDNIVNTIARAIPGYIGEIKLDYVIAVTDRNYDELVVTPKQNVLLLTYHSDEKNVRKIFEDLARAFRFDEQVTFAVLDADKYPQLLKDRFGYQQLPSVFWYDYSDKHNKLLFGGKINPVALMMFVNERTHLWRRKDGHLEPQAGRIEELDVKYKKYIPEIKEGDAITMTNIITDMSNVDVRHSWETDFAEYYIELLEKIAELGEPLRTLGTERDEVVNMLNDPDIELTQKQRDFFMRKQNVVDFMITSMKQYDEAKENEKKAKVEAILNAPPVIRRIKRVEL